MWTLANLISILILAYLVSVAYKKRALVREYREAILRSQEHAEREPVPAREDES